MKRNLLLSLILFLFLHAAATAQEKRWTLHDCLDYAIEHNIQLKRSRIGLQAGEEDTRQARAQMFPSLSASVGQNILHVPAADAFGQGYTGSYNLNASWTLFDAGRRRDAVRQQELQDRINLLGVDQNEREIRILLVQTYMQVLYAHEAVRINENTVEVSKAQRDRAEELLSAGSISRVSFAQLESQYSTDRYQLVVAGKNLDNYKLQLKQLLELDISEDIALAIPVLGDEDVMAPLRPKEVIYATALSVMPEVESGELSVGMAEIETRRAAAAFMPSLSMNAGLGTANSSGVGMAFGDQLWNRFNETVGVTLSIPILSNRTHKTALNKARFSLADSRLELAGAHKALLRSVEGVYLDATSAQNQYVASAERLKYITESYRLTEEQFFLGMKNTLELLTEKNNMLSAQQEELQSKYMAIMSIQLLNIYQKRAVNPAY
ncbi:MAG: TolC family protein [Tannerellaceae bacterium]|jgi:outer membrane protein|nr:TolC family protein [Tannerellaceae bacterium]